jgi:hypothetical protein
MQRFLQFTVMPAPVYAANDAGVEAVFVQQPFRGAATWIFSTRSAPLAPAAEAAVERRDAVAPATTPITAGPTHSRHHQQQQQQQWRRHLGVQAGRCACG